MKTLLMALNKFCPVPMLQIGIAKNLVAMRFRDLSATLIRIAIVFSPPWSLLSSTMMENFSVLHASVTLLSNDGAIALLIM